MSKSYFKRTPPASLNLQNTKNSIQTQIYIPPRTYGKSQDELRLDMKRNTLKHNFSTMKSCLDDMKWIFNECNEVIRQSTIKQNSKSMIVRFDNLTKQLQNLQSRFQSINISDVADSLTSSPTNTSKKCNKLFKTSKLNEISLSGQATLPLNYIIQSNRHKSTNRGFNKTISGISKILFLEQKQNIKEGLQFWKMENQKLKMNFLSHKQSQIKIISQIKQTLSQIQSQTPNTQDQRSKRHIMKLLDGFVKYQQQVKKIVNNTKVSKQLQVDNLLLERNQLLVKIQQMKFENQLLLTQRDDISYVNIQQQVPHIDQKVSDSYCFLLMQAQSLEKMLQ